jgi:hypothetical protein
MSEAKPYMPRFNRVPLCHNLARHTLHAGSGSDPAGAIGHGICGLIELTDREDELSCK